MKRRCLFTIASVFFLAGSLGLVDEKDDKKNPEAKPITVKMKSMSYDPKKLEINLDDAVVWSNEAHTNHTATSDDDGKTFNTEEVEPGKSSKPVKFEKEGEFKYHCKIHGRTMAGTIVVKAAEKK